MVALILAAVLASQPVEPRASGRVTVTILAAAEVHFDRAEQRRLLPLEHTTIRGEDGIRRSALLVEFQ